jgi:hypothetical protein
MHRIHIVAAAVALGFAVAAYAEEQPGLPKPKIPPAEVTVKVDAPEGTSEQDIAAAIAGENAKRDPEAQAAAAAAQQKAEADQAHAMRKSKVCDSISEDAMRRDPSLRRMCQ